MKQAYRNSIEEKKKDTFGFWRKKNVLTDAIYHDLIEINRVLKAYIS